MFALHVDDELTLRLFEEQDAQPLFDLIDENRQFLQPWLEFEAATRDSADTLDFIRRTRDSFTNSGRFWAGVLQHGQLVGAVGIVSLDAPNRSAEIGYWLARDATGRGLMTRACRAMINHLFTCQGVNRVSIRCAVNNAAGHAVARRLGFHREGTLRQAEFLRGSFRDVALFSLLAHEWCETKDGSTDESSAIREDPDYAHLRLITEGEGLGPWRKIAEERRIGFQSELMKEIGPGHPLWGLPVSAVGTRTDGNEILCMIEDGSKRVAIVHLTWSGTSESPRYPATQFFRTFERFVMHVMQDEYFLPRGPDISP